jgi:hypothetical protein
MKITLPFVILCCSLTTIFASLNLPPYSKSKAPSLSLPDAYDLAIAALGQETNQFHCLSANVTTLFTTEGEWYFTFYSTNAISKTKCIAVEFNGKIVFDNGYR